MADTPPISRNARSRWWPTTLIVPLSIAVLWYGSISSHLRSSDFAVKQSTQLNSKSLLEQSTLFGEVLEGSNATLYKRDDKYGCKKGQPCKQFACCGAFQGTDEGICGLGPAWCGDDCDSQCNAKAECKLIITSLPGTIS